MAKTEKEPTKIFEYSKPALPEGQASSLVKQSDLGIKDSDFEDYGAIHVGEDINKLREKNQSGFEQAGSFLTQAAGEVVGGAISGIGATLDIPDAVITEYNDKDADFKNIITEAGDAISEWSKEAAPIYRKNPGQAFDVTDSGWWFENGVSVASTLSLMIPAVGTVKGIGYIGKMLGLADELKNAGKLVRAGKSLGLVEDGVAGTRKALNTVSKGLSKADYFGRIATSAIVSRNAENFKESSQVLNSTKETLLKEWDENPDKFDNLLESDVAKELQATGRDVTKENLANYVASKAAWLSYGVNSLNIAFDAIQMAPLFKGFKPNKLNASLGVKKAQKEALGKTFTKTDYLSAALNPFSSAVARNATEGIEEAINYVGTKEGENYADELTGKKTKELSGRIKDYLKDPHMYESAAWGVIGGIAFGGAANAVGQVANMVQGRDNNSLKDARINEITNRVTQIKAASAYIKDIEKNDKLSDEEKQHHIANAKADIVTNLSINAAQLGNYDMLVEHLSSPQMKKEMLDSGYSNEGDVDKAVAKSLVDAQIAKSMYDSNYNLFQTKNIDANTKSIQVAQKTYWDSVSRKHLEQKNQLSKDIEILKANDNYYNTSSDLNKNSTIQLEALKRAKQSILNITENSNEPLSEYQKEILSTVDKKIEDLDKATPEKATLNLLNPKILDKQIEVEQKNMIIEALAYKVNYMTTPAFTKKIEDDIKQVKDTKKKEDLKEFKEEVNTKTKEELKDLKGTTKDKTKEKIVDSKIEEITKKEETTKRKDDVKVSKDVVETSPVNNRTDNQIFDVFDEEFPIEAIDETKIPQDKKTSIDNAILGEDWGSLIQIDSMTNGTIEQKYLRNKIQERKKELLDEFNKNQTVVIANEIPVSDNTEDTISEENLAKLDGTQFKKTRDTNGLLFAKKTSGENNVNSTKIFLDVLNEKAFDDSEQINKDVNNNLVVTKDNEKSVTQLYSLQAGNKVSLKIDTSNALYERYKDDLNEVPIAVYSNDIRIGYITGRKRSINTNEFKFITNLRNNMGTDINKSVEYTITEKTNGDVINTKEWQNIKDLNLDNFEFYAVKASSDGHTLERLSQDKAYHVNENKPYGKLINTPQGSVNLRGVVYLMLHNANGSPFPTPLKVSKLSEKDAVRTEKLIHDMLNLLDSGESLESQKIHNFREEISKYILVDDTRDISREQLISDKKYQEIVKFEQTAQTEESKIKLAELQEDYLKHQSQRRLNFRVHQKTKNKPARIEMTYISGDGNKRKIVYSRNEINIYDAKTNEKLHRQVSVLDDKGTPIFKNVFTDQGDVNVLGKVLQNKYYNISFKKLKSGDEEYKNKIIAKGILKTNVGELRTESGTVLGNFTNFGIRISSTSEKSQVIIEVKKEDSEQIDQIKTTSNLLDNLFNLKTTSKVQGLTEFKENYSLYTNNKTTSSKIIDEILVNPQSELIRQAAEYLKNNKNPVDLQLKDIKQINTLAVYDALNNIINISDRNRFKTELAFQETILHELTHAATLLPILKYKEFLVKEDKNIDFTSYTFKEGTPKHVIDFITSMENHRDKATKTISYKFPEASKLSIEQSYGLTDVYEFISEVFTNTAFREAIKADKNLLDRIIDTIVKFLNELFNVNISSTDTNDAAVKEIVKFINAEKKESYANLVEGLIPVMNTNYAQFRKATDKKITDIFTSEEKNYLVNFTTNATLRYFKSQEDIDSLGTDRPNNSKDFVKSKIQLALDTIPVNDNQKELLNKTLENFDIIWIETLNQTNRIFGTRIDTDENANLDLNETLELQKNWDDNIANSTAMNDQLSKEVKWFIATTSQKDIDNNSVQNVVTGLPESVNYASSINLMIKHLHTAQTELDLLNKLETLKVINPSFKLMADNLRKDSNLLAAFKSQFTRNILDSNILLISKIDEYIKAKVDNEFKKTKGYINIADNWNKVINNNIDNGYYQTEAFKSLFAEVEKQKRAFEKYRLEENYLSTNNKLTEKGNELVSILFNYSNLLGIGLSIPAIEDSVKSARTIDDVSIYSRLDNSWQVINKGEKNNINQNLNTIAVFQDKYDIEFAEIMALNLKGEPVYAAQLPSFLTNFFARLKTDNKEVRTQFEREIIEILSNDPVMQKSNWAWADETQSGLFNYVTVGGKKEATTINDDYVAMWNVAKLGGAKNTITKDTQDYTEFSDNTYKMTLGYMYLEQRDTKNPQGNKYCWTPSLIPSDSGNLVMLKVNRFALKDGDLTITKDGNKISNISLAEDSKTFRAIQNATFQEFERMKQAYDLVFDVREDGLRLRKEYYNRETDTLTEDGKVWFSQLEKNYHYTKISYKENSNEVDIKKTLIKDGKPTGRVFQFHNLKLTNTGKFKTTSKNKSITLSDLEAFSKPYELIGSMSENFINNTINPFIQEYVRQLVENEIIEFADLRNEGVFDPSSHAFIGDGTFDQFVAEMALNNYIHNVEQQVWFNGVSAEYKNNVDTNKRAKQMTAPGNAPSTSGASEYVAITIQDISLPSNTYDTITKYVKEGLLREKAYRYKSNPELLEQDVKEITKDYLDINSGDAQGYITVEGLKELFTKYGMMNDTYIKIFKQIESGEQLTTEAIKTLQAVKPFAYERKYNHALNKMSSNQIKLSYLPLIPQLIAGTDLEKLAKVMNEKKATRAFFESAHKVGAKQIYKIADEKGVINDNWLKDVQPELYSYANEQIQLTVPDHLVDSTNLLATQIAKLIIANLSSDAIYNLNGRKLTGEELKNEYFDILVRNIEDSKDNLISDIKITKDEDGKYTFESNEALRELLLDEIKNRGLGKNYEDAIQLDESGEFLLPLFTGKNADKWESILTSVFTNRIMKQKLPGASLTLASDLFINKSIQENIKKVYQGYNELDNRKINYYTESEEEAKTYGNNIRKVNINTDNFFKRKNNEEEYVKLFNEFRDKTKQTFDILDNTKEGLKVQETFFNFLEEKGYEGFDNTGFEDNRYIISFNNKNKNIKGIEWQDGHDGVLKSYRDNEEGIQVVEVLMGSWSKKFFKDGQRISINNIPADVRTMVGYRIPTQAKHSMVVFKVVGFLPEESKGSIIMPNDIITQMGSDFDIDKLFVMYKNFVLDEENNLTTEVKEASYRRIKSLEKVIKNLEKAKILDEFTISSYNKISKEYDETETIGITESYDEVVVKLNKLINKIERQERENSIIDIYKSVLTNPHHLKESFTPATFADFVKGKQVLDKLFETSDDNIDILSPLGQRTFRKRNMAGRVLKGISANFNSFLPVAQNTNMYLTSKLQYTQKVRIKGEPINDYEKVYNVEQLNNRYLVDVKGDYAYVTLGRLGRSNTDYQNIDGNIITEVASQGIGAAVDIVKDPTFDAFNATTYTYPQFNTGLAVGMNPMYMMFFTRQPIIKLLNDEYFNNQSLLGENTGQEREKIRAVYESLLLNAINGENTVPDPRNNPKLFNKEDRQKLFGYTLEDSKHFSDGELYGMLEQSKKGHSKLNKEEKIQYYKNQLFVLNQFNLNKEAGDAVQDVLKAVKTDAIGAGPTLEKTVELDALIAKSGEASKVLIGEFSAVASIYPKLFGKKEKSVYPVIESYFENVNELSYRVLSPLFITQNHNYKRFKNQLKGSGVKINQYNDKLVKKFFNKSILQDLDLFNDIHKHRVLGTSEYKSGDFKLVNFDGTIEYFSKLSAQDMTVIIKELSAKEVQKQQSSIINRLIPNDKYSELGYSKLDFNTNYKDTMLDDTFAEQLEVMYNSGDEFKKEYVKTLLQYNYFANGMEFGFGSISKVLPPNVLITEGIGEHLKSKNEKSLSFNLNLDQFFRNNWQNGEIVPKVRIKYLKKDGERVIATDEFGNDMEENGQPVYETVDNTPRWTGNSNVIQISANQLKNEPDNVRNSPYISLTNTTKVEDKNVYTQVLYQKYEQYIELFETARYNSIRVDYEVGSTYYQVINVKEAVNYKDALYFEVTNKNKEKVFLTVDLVTGDLLDQYNEKTDKMFIPMLGTISVTPQPKSEFYYRVNTLGKDGIIELSDKSMWLENNLTDEDANYTEIENRILNINKNSIGLTNISQEIQDKHDKECGGL